MSAEQHSVAMVKQAIDLMREHPGVSVGLRDAVVEMLGELLAIRAKRHMKRRKTQPHE